MDAQGNEFQVISEATTEEEGHNHESESSESSGGENCHFHAGVEYAKPYHLYSPVLTKQALRWGRRI